MQVVVRLMRSRGIPLPADLIASTLWTEGRLCMSREDGARCLILRRLNANPDQGVIASLYQAAVAQVSEGHLELRGIERVNDERGTAAVVQVWQVRPRPSFGDLGRLHPDAKGIVDYLVRAR